MATVLVVEEVVGPPSVVEVDVGIEELGGEVEPVGVPVVVVPAPVPVLEPGCEVPGGVEVGGAVPSITVVRVRTIVTAGTVEVGLLVAVPPSAPVVVAPAERTTIASGRLTWVPKLPVKSSTRTTANAVALSASAVCHARDAGGRLGRLSIGGNGAALGRTRHGDNSCSIEGAARQSTRRHDPLSPIQRLSQLCFGL